MARVGIRELKQNASAVVRRAAAGETVEITDRGRPVARMGPLGDKGVLERMVAEGRATEAEGDLLDHAPIDEIAGKRSLSTVLAEMRSDER